MTDPLAAISPWRTQRTEWLWAELELIAGRWRVTDHPLTAELAVDRMAPEHVAMYVAEHDHVLVAGAALAGRAAAAGGLVGHALVAHAEYRRSQVSRWRAFAVDAGWSAPHAWYYGEDPFVATVEVARAIAGEPDDLASQLVTLRVLATIEADVGAALGARTRRYGLGGSRERGRVDAALQGVIADADVFRLLRRCERVHRLYWHLLDDLAASRRGDCLAEVR